MLTKKELLKHPNYLLTKYQSEIFRQIVDYMDKNNLTQREIADKLKVSNAYVSQILNGEFNFTLKKLIEIALVIGKVPALEFVDEDEFWRRQNEGTVITKRKYVPVYFFNIENSDSFLDVNPSPISININEPKKEYA